MALDDWGKHYIKFLAETKSLAAETANYNLDDTEGLWKALETTDKQMEGHEKKLGAAAIDAYEAGVVSKKLAEFMKHKAFADAKKALDIDRKNLVAGLKMLEVQCNKCKAGATKAYDLSQRMSKAIVGDKTKEKNPEREKVKKLREGVMATFEELTQAEKLRHKPPKYMVVFDAQYDKLIDHLIAEALKKGKDPKEALEVPQPLTDKNLGLLAKEATRYVTNIGGNVAEIESINGKVTSIKDKLSKLKADRKAAEAKGDAKAAAKAKEAEDALGTDAVALRDAAEALVGKADKSFEKLKAIVDKTEKLETQFKAEIALLAAKEQADLAAQFKAMRTNLKKTELNLEKAVQTTNKMYSA